jgi:nitrous oxidase accessory protein
MKEILWAFFVITLIAICSCVTYMPVSAGSATLIVPDNYRTIASAIGNATEGDTIYIKSGTYLEHTLIIDKTISLEGENAQTTIIQNIDNPTFFLTSPMLAGPNAINIEPQADDVIITGLTVRTNNTGADKTFLGYSIRSYANNTQILGNILPDGISLARFGQAGPVGYNKLVTGNFIGQVGDNFAIVSEAPYTYIYNNTIIGGVKLQNCYGHDDLNDVVYANTISTNLTYSYWQAWGVNIYMAQGNFIANNTITNSYAGIVTDLSSNNTIVGNTITNSNIGLAAIQGGGGNEFYSNTVSNCSYSAAAAGYYNYFYHNNFIDNLSELADPNSLMGPNDQRAIYWSKNNQGNFWSKYTGIDANADCIGDSSYAMDANNIDPYPLIAPYTQATITLPSWTNNIVPSKIPPTIQSTVTPNPPSSTQTTSEKNSSTPPATDTPTPLPNTAKPEPSATQLSSDNQQQYSVPKEKSSYILVFIIIVIGIIIGASLLWRRFSKKPNYP